MNFYKNVMRVAVPIMIQNGITNLVGMLDNVMVGRLGTDAMSGVAIVNQLMFIFNLCIFGALSGIGIFTAQFYGKGDDDGIRHTVRQQVLVSVFLAIVGAAVFLFWGDPLIRLYLHSDGSGGSVEATFAHAKDYLTVMYAGLLPFALAQVY
ncbi:MAG: MATE family efflux transporter, partial [Blautia sp.]|nr:MATE family efflux transporter [Blautia sp.]